jgi:hypothetical protein
MLAVSPHGSQSSGTKLHSILSHIMVVPSELLPQGYAMVTQANAIDFAFR